MRGLAPNAQNAATRSCQLANCRTCRMSSGGAGQSIVGWSVAAPACAAVCARALVSVRARRVCAQGARSCRAGAHEVPKDARAAAANPTPSPVDVPVLPLAQSHVPTSRPARRTAKPNAGTRDTRGTAAPFTWSARAGALLEAPILLQRLAAGPAAWGWGWPHCTPAQGGSRWGTHGGSRVRAKRGSTAGHGLWPATSNRGGTPRLGRGCCSRTAALPGRGPLPARCPHALTTDWTVPP